MLFIKVLNNTYSIAMTLHLWTLPIFIVHKNVWSFLVANQRFILAKSTSSFCCFLQNHQRFEVLCKQHRPFFVSSKPIQHFIIMTCAHYQSIAFVNHLLWAITFGLACSSNTSHNPLRLLLMVNLGVHAMSTINGEYFVLACMPQQ
jgi:hypothetical protein